MTLFAVRNYKVISMDKLVWWLKFIY